MKKMKDHSGLHHKLQAIIDQNIRRRADGAVSSSATRKKIASTLHLCFRELSALGYKLSDPMHLKGRHINALGRHYERQGQDGKLKPSTIQGRFSVLRQYARWIGKEGMVLGTEKYVESELIRRTSLCAQDKSWQAQGVDVNAKLQEICAKDERVGLQVKLELLFGLRSKEAIMLCPHLADKGSYLDVSVGTKGGRPRAVPIRTPEQRALLEAAKAMTSSKASSTGDTRMSLLQWKNHYYYVLRSCGITRVNGLTAHGLRHAYANDRHKELTGQDSPVRGGKLIDRNEDRAARLQLAEELGHSRERITTYYLGRDMGSKS